MSSDQGTHFWFMAIQTPNGSGYCLADYQGVCTPCPGATRLDVFNDLREGINRQHPQSRGGTVIAFDIQPNQI
jgi:hypothetical protein